MKILFIIPYVPSLVRVRPYQIIKQIKERGHNVTLATLVTNQQEKEDLAHFEQYCDDVIAVKLPTYKSLLNSGLALPSKLPLQSVYSWNANLLNQIKKNLYDNDGRSIYDIIHIEHLRGSQYGVRLIHIKNSANHNLPPIVWDSVDCISYLFKQAAEQRQKGIRQIITKFEIRRTEREEKKLVSLFDQVLVTSQKDEDALLKLAPERAKHITVLPNGVDLNYFKPCVDEKRESDTLIVSGKMSYHANLNMVLYLVNEIMPLVWHSQPNVKLWVVGKDPPKQLLSLAKNSRITVTGFVDSILPYLRKASIAVAPLRYGAGIQNKVLEAMACGTPIITTPKAISALNIEPGKEVIVGENVTDFAKKINELLNDPSRRKTIGKSARAYVELHHNWQKIGRNLEQIYENSLIRK